MIRLAVATVALIAVEAASAASASPEFVGILAYAASVEDAKAVGLDDAAHQKLLALIEQREAKALELIQAKDANAANVVETLKTFAAESEQLGLALLSREQLAKLRQRRLETVGMVALGEADIAAQLELTDDQKKRVAELIQQRDEETSKGSRTQRRVAELMAERRLLAVLTDTQKASWSRISGTPLALKVAEAGVAAKDPPATAVNPALAAKSTAEREVDEEAKLVFNFADTPWREVFEWLAGETNLALQATKFPPDSFTYTGDPRAYTINEAMDRINSVLLTKGFLLLRRYNMLMVIERSELPPDLVELITEEQLEKDDLGTFELYRCIFQLSKANPSDLEAEVTGLVGPGFEKLIRILPQAKQIMVTETVGNLKLIHRVIEAVEDPAKYAQNLKSIQLKHVLADEVMTVARPLLGLAPEENTNENINISVDAFGTRLFAIGKDESIATLEEVVKLVDKEAEEGGNAEIASQPELRTYDLRGTDPEMVVPVIKTLLAGIPDGRADADLVSKKLIVWARPEDHVIVEKFHAVLRGAKDEATAIPLRNSDPALVVATLSTLMGLGEEENPSTLRLEADSSAMRIFARGNPDEIAEVKKFVEEIEGPIGGDAFGTESPIRKIPITGDNATKAITQMLNLWPAISKNKVVEVSPDQLKQRMFEERSLHDEALPKGDSGPIGPFVPRGATPPGAGDNNRPMPMPAPAEKPKAEADDKSPQTTSLPRAGKVQFVTTPVDNTQFVQAPIQPPAPAKSSAPASGEPAPADGPQNGTKANPTLNRPGAEILVTKTDDGIVIVSQDLAELDRFESMMRQLFQGYLGDAGIADLQFQVYYLKYRPADEALKLLKEILGGSGLGLADAAGGLFDSVTDSLLPGGGLLDMFSGGGGGGGNASGDGMTIQIGTTVEITADRRLNRLFVRGDPKEVEMVEQVLVMIDKESSITEIETDGAAHVIPVLYTDAETIAKVVREVFASDLQSSGGGQGAGGNDAAQILQALQRAGGRGGRGGAQGGGGGGGDQGTAPPKMTLSVDANSNSIVVVASQQLYQKVQSLVNDIDVASRRDQQEYSVIPLSNVNPTLVQDALNQLLGTGASSSNSSTPSSSSGNNGPAGGGSGAPQVSDQQRQQIMEAIQRRNAGGGGGAPGGARGGIQAVPGRGGAPGGGRGGAGGGRGGAQGGSVPGGGVPGGGRGRGGR